MRVAVALLIVTSPGGIGGACPVRCGGVLPTPCTVDAATGPAPFDDDDVHAFALHHRPGG